jgi:hypothetical protein
VATALDLFKFYYFHKLASSFIAVLNEHYESNRTTNKHLNVTQRRFVLFRQVIAAQHHLQIQTNKNAGSDSLTAAALNAFDIKHLVFRAAGTVPDIQFLPSLISTGLCASG